MSDNKFSYGSDKLTPYVAVKIAKGKISAAISDAQVAKITASRGIIESLSKSSDVVYGVNTGFGALCNTIISEEESNQLQENLLRSHAVGVGKDIPALVAKIMMVLKIHSLSLGFSGVRLEVIQKIKFLLEKNITPCVPIKGSVGASGDLAPLAHLFLPLIGEGHVIYDGVKYKSSVVFKKENIKPLKISKKEGLALINGTQFISAFACVSFVRFKNCLDNADLISVMSLEGTLSAVSPFHLSISDLRNYSGSSHVSKKVRELTKNSEILNSHQDCGKVQDPYSIRCIPQVHGASWDAFYHLEETLNIELNSVTDNPLVIDNKVISGGNFHGQPVAIPIDYNIIAASELGNISDRRTYLLLKGNSSVPKLLIKKSGVNSGFMILQYTSAALTSENKNLCFPASADSITTSLGQEDHVSMGSIGAVKFLKVVKNLEKIIAIELLCSAQAIDFLRPLKSSKKIEECHKLLRSEVSFAEEDRVFSDDITKAAKLVKSGKLVDLIN
mgnify:FL=1